MPFVTVSLNHSSITETTVGIPNSITISAYNDNGTNLTGAPVTFRIDNSFFGSGSTDINGQSTIGNIVFSTAGTHSISGELSSNPATRTTKNINVLATGQTGTVTTTTSGGQTSVGSSTGGTAVTPGTPSPTAVTTASDPAAILQAFKNSGYYYALNSTYQAQATADPRGWLAGHPYLYDTYPFYFKAAAPPTTTTTGTNTTGGSNTGGGTTNTSTTTGQTSTGQTSTSGGTLDPGNNTTGNPYGPGGSSSTSTGGGSVFQLPAGTTSGLILPVLLLGGGALLLASRKGGRR